MVRVQALRSRSIGPVQSFKLAGVRLQAQWCVISNGFVSNASQDVLALSFVIHLVVSEYSQLKGAVHESNLRVYFMYIERGMACL